MTDLPREITETMEKLCKAAAQALHRYAGISGIDPGRDMPESFVASYICDHLGDEITATVETNFRKLLEWNANRKAATSSVVDDIERKVDHLQKRVSKKRVDLVIYGSGEKKSDKPMLILVEFKREAIDRGDRVKLLSILEEIDTCPFGAIVSYLSTPP